VFVAVGTIADFDFHWSNGFIYWAGFALYHSRYIGLMKKLSIHRIKPDGSNYADIVTAVATVKLNHNISALAINWIEGRI